MILSLTLDPLDALFTYSFSYSTWYSSFSSTSSFSSFSSSYYCYFSSWSSSFTPLPYLSPPLPPPILLIFYLIISLSLPLLSFPSLPSLLFVHFLFLLFPLLFLLLLTLILHFISPTSFFRPLNVPMFSLSQSLNGGSVHMPNENANVTSRQKKRTNGWRFSTTFTLQTMFTNQVCCYFHMIDWIQYFLLWLHFELEWKHGNRSTMYLVFDTLHNPRRLPAIRMLRRHNICLSQCVSIFLLYCILQL